MVKRKNTGLIAFWPTFVSSSLHACSRGDLRNDLNQTLLQLFCSESHLKIHDRNMTVSSPKTWGPKPLISGNFARVSSERNAFHRQTKLYHKIWWTSGEIELTRISTTVKVISGKFTRRSPNASQPNFVSWLEVGQIWEYTSTIWGSYLLRNVGPKTAYYLAVLRHHDLSANIFGTKCATGKRYCE